MPENTKATGGCLASVIPGIIGRRRLRAPLSVSWTSAPTGSVRRAVATVRTVVRCVASRNRERGPLGPGTKPPGPPSGPNPLGENITLSSPPLEPRGLLLSVMRQKVGKERSQGDCHPLGYPPPLLPEVGRNNSSKTPGGRVALPPGIGAVASGRSLRENAIERSEKKRASRAGRRRPERPKVAVVQLTAHLRTTNRESSASGAVPSGTPIGPDG